MALVTFSEQQLIVPLSVHYERYYEQLANETEYNEIRELLGAEFLQDVENNPTTPDNVLLLNGANYTRPNGNNYIHKGLKYVISYLIYSNYIQTSDIKDTFSGFVQKNTDESTPAPYGRLKDRINYYRNLALNEFNYVKEFLDVNKLNYPLWNQCETKTPYKPKYKFMKNTQYGN